MCSYLVENKGGSDHKASAYNAGHLGSIPGSGRSPEGGNRNPLQYPSLESPMTAWRATAYGAAESDTTEHACMIESM